MKKIIKIFYPYRFFILALVIIISILLLWYFFVGKYHGFFCERYSYAECPSLICERVGQCSSQDDVSFSLAPCQCKSLWK